MRGARIGRVRQELVKMRRSTRTLDSARGCCSEPGELFGRAGAGALPLGDRGEGAWISCQEPFSARRNTRHAEASLAAPGPSPSAESAAEPDSRPFPTFHTAHSLRNPRPVPVPAYGSRDSLTE